MKKILSLVIVLIVIGQVSAKDVEPKSPQGISVIKHGALVKLFYRGEHSGKVKVTIYDESGTVVFTETMRNTEHFMRPYNFEPLPTGDYTIELTDAQGKRSQKVHHQPADNKRIAHLTRLSDHENRYMLAIPNDGSDEIRVRIYDEDNTLLYEEEEAINGNFAKVYSLNGVGGEHVFDITDKSGKGNRLSKPIR
jgi:hypothetical protein